MRDQIKQLIDLVEGEGWLFRDGPLRDGCTTGIQHFRPLDESFPRICLWGFQLDPETYERFLGDEASYMSEVFKRYSDAKELNRHTTVDKKITQFLARRFR